MIHKRESSQFKDSVGSDDPGSAQIADQLISISHQWQPKYDKNSGKKVKTQETKLKERRSEALAQLPALRQGKIRVKKQDTQAKPKKPLQLVFNDQQASFMKRVQSHGNLVMKH